VHSQLFVLFGGNFKVATSPIVDAAKLFVRSNTKLMFQSVCALDIKQLLPARSGLHILAAASVVEYIEKLISEVKKRSSVLRNVKEI
jgi:hypothetical protein